MPVLKDFDTLEFRRRDRQLLELSALTGYSIPVSALFRR